MKTKNKTWFSGHSHSWQVILIAIILAILFIHLLPEKKYISKILFGLAASHLLLLLIGLFTAWVLIPEKVLRIFARKKVQSGYNFGWSVKWMNGWAIASVLVFLLAIYSYFSLSNHPLLKLIIFTILLLLSINFFIGNIILRTSKSEKNMTLPYVDLYNTANAKVLDAGCGSGRTTIILGTTNPNIHITAFDRFDAGYIDDGGKLLLKNNIELAGLTNRVTIEQGDIIATQFQPDSFDSAVSAFMFDHLGENKLAALNETFRILRPGGRFLLIVLTRGYASFAIGNIFSFMLSSSKDWNKLFNLSNFKLLNEGNINGATYFLIEKPKI